MQDRAVEKRKERFRLDEVTLMRTILAILIVFYHAFACYNHGWKAPEGFVDIPSYKWLSRIAYPFALEAFVFISGYLLAFQQITLNRRTGFGALVVNKLKRLMLPSIIFSTAYFAIFSQYKGAGDFVYSIFNGSGHLWFLPMLFWCFIGGWLLEQVKISDGWKLAFLVCLNLFWPISLPLRITHATNYLLYFYGGYVAYKHRDKILSIITPKRIVWSWVLFVIVFIIFRPLKDSITDGDPCDQITRLMKLFGRDACLLMYASFGTVTFYITALWYTSKHQLKTSTVELASCCFGIYLLQQFILQLLYYKTGFAAAVGPYWLPWLGFMIAFPLSYLLAHLLLKTKTGKFLIG